MVLFQDFTKRGKYLAENFKGGQIQIRGGGANSMLKIIKPIAKWGSIPRGGVVKAPPGSPHPEINPNMTCMYYMYITGLSTARSWSTCNTYMYSSPLIRVSWSKPHINHIYKKIACTYIICMYVCMYVHRFVAMLSMCSLCMCMRANWYGKDHQRWPHA